MLAVSRSIVSFAGSRALLPAALLTIMLAASCSMLRPEAENNARTDAVASPETVGSLATTPIGADESRDAAPERAQRETSPLPTIPPEIATQMAEREAEALDAPLAAGETATPITSHTVAAGETLTRIAERYAVSVAALLAANELSNPDFLEIGQVLLLPQPPVDYTSAFRILPDSRLVRSVGASEFNSAQFIRSMPGALRAMTDTVPTRASDGATHSEELGAGAVVQRVSREYSVDARILLAFLEYSAGLLTDASVDPQRQRYPLLDASHASYTRDRAGLYRQLIWLADTLNRGYYDWKYRAARILEFAADSRLYYEPSLNAGTVAVQYALAKMREVADWEQDIEEDGLYRSYRQLFGDPFAGAFPTVPPDLSQPRLTLPFPRGDVWRFTGGFHGGWGNGSAWAAVDFAPPAETGQGGGCYVSSYPITAAAGGTIARLETGVVVLDLDFDGDEGSGWTLLYLHLDRPESLQEEQTVEAGSILGYASCAGGFSAATHLHLARRYNGEWLPADCNRCPPEATVPAFVMSGWKVVGLGNQLYQGFMVNMQDNRSTVAEQGRFSDINAISW